MNGVCVAQQMEVTSKKYRADNRRNFFVLHILSLWNPLPQDMATSSDDFHRGSEKLMTLLVSSQWPVLMALSQSVSPSCRGGAAGGFPTGADVGNGRLG